MVGIAFERLDRFESNMMALPANSGILFQGRPNMVRSNKASTWCREIARTSMKPTIITAHPEGEYDSYGCADLGESGLDALTVPIPTFVERDRSSEVGDGWLQLKQL
jgi:hypothetical protein